MTYLQIFFLFSLKKYFLGKNIDQILTTHVYLMDAYFALHHDLLLLLTIIHSSSFVTHR